MSGYPGKQGRKPKATTIVESQRGKVETGNLPPAPAHLNDDAKEAWRNLRKLLNEAGITCKLDKNAVELYCTTYARWREAQRMIDKHGMLVKTPNGYPVQSPYIAIVNQATIQLTKLLQEFGMTPASRTRIPVGEDTERAPRRKVANHTVDPREILEALN